MEKKTLKAFGKTVWLLGKDKDGINYWLEEPSWDCDWYWGFGYVETYEDNKSPDKAKDISSHQHFDGLFLDGPKCARDMFKDFFVETPLSDDEIWELVDYMKTFYTLKSVAELFKHGYSWQTSRAKMDEIQRDEQNDLVNKVWLPEVFKRITKIFE
jgi:hypothetical protein